MIKSITIGDFLSLEQSVKLADVRTPAEFEHGHIPGAFNLPLFSNEERVQVGTTYKQVGREQAILLGFDLTGPKWSGFIRQALEMAPDKKIAVHCWRGGMRSGAMAWALNLYGFDVYLIEGGYKQYRRWVLDQFETLFQLVILGGMTGSGKTRILQQLRTMNQQVIDLEDLAKHQGSSYGTLNRLIQPTQEQFENNLADQLKTLDRQRPVWVEDESLKIGKLIIPNSFWRLMGASVLIDIQVDLEKRVANLVDDYGKLDKDFLMVCTQRIHKRLGPLQTKQAIAAIQEDRMADFIRLALVYYDKSYRNALGKRKADQIFSLPLSNSAISSCAEQLISFIETIDVQKKGVQTNEYTNS
ncbi:tRNA 2-selenouridine(34) synthase MnmH [Spirosoma harenae]